MAWRSSGETNTELVDNLVSEFSKSLLFLTKEEIRNGVFCVWNET